MLCGSGISLIHGGGVGDGVATSAFVAVIASLLLLVTMAFNIVRDGDGISLAMLYTRKEKQNYSCHNYSYLSLLTRCG